jgi:plastocyanin
MTVRARNRTIAGGLIIGVIALAVSLLPMMASPADSPVREVRLVVRGMTFYVEGQTDPNPAIALRAGEQVRITLRNEDAGMRHDFAIKAWSIATRTLDDRGQATAITFRVPDEKGTQTYFCTPHSTMMQGTLRIE